MMANVCGKEKRTRTIVGIILIVAGFIVGSTLGLVLGIIGGVSLITALFSYCPFNQMLGRNTCKLTTPTGRDYVERKDYTETKL